jgi:DNA-binding CsgD family transcriptional regulator
MLETPRDHEQLGLAQFMEEESQNMGRTPIPQVIDDHLHLTEQHEHRNIAPIAVGSSFWYNWLADERNKSFSFKSPLGTFTARHERQRNNWYWYAYHKHQGKTHKAYLGKPEELTIKRLYTIASTLALPKPSTTQQEPSPPIPNTTNNNTVQNNQEQNILDYLEKVFVLRSLIQQAQYEYPGALTILSQLLSMTNDQTYQQANKQEDTLGMLLTQLQAIDTMPAPATSTAPPPLPATTLNKKHLERFTRRERTVLELLLQGATNRTIANQLVISEGTVKKHVSNICGKLNVRNRSQAIAIVFSWQHEAKT